MNTKKLVVDGCLLDTLQDGRISGGENCGLCVLGMLSGVLGIAALVMLIWVGWAGYIGDSSMWVIQSYN